MDSADLTVEPPGAGAASGAMRVGSPTAVGAHDEGDMLLRPPLEVRSLGNAVDYHLKNATLVGGSSLIYNADFTRGYAPYPFNPATDELEDEVGQRIVRLRDGEPSYRFKHPPRPIAHIGATAVPLNLIHPANYFHFLIESLPTLVTLIDRGALDEDAVVVSGQLHPNMNLALNFAIAPKELSVLQLRYMQAVTCDRVVTTPRSAHSTHLIGGGSSDCRYDSVALHRLRRRFQTLLDDAAAEPRIKLFVRRASTFRAFTNSEEVEAIVRDAGYLVIEPEIMILFNQIRHFGRAAHIIGPTGAWASNLLFAAPDAHVDIFFPDTHRYGMSAWGAFGAVFGMTVNEVYCPVTKYNETYPVHSDFRAPAELVKSLLR